jgi:hypothetical protein
LQILFKNKKTNVKTKKIPFEKSTSGKSSSMFSTAGFKIGSKLSSAKFTAIFGATIDGRT